MPKEETVALYRERILRFLRHLQEQLDFDLSIVELSNRAMRLHIHVPIERSRPRA